MRIYIAGNRINIGVEPVWWAQNGATRRRLTLYIAKGLQVQEVDKDIPVYRVDGLVYPFESHNEGVVRIAAPNQNSQKTLHIWLNSHCGVDVYPIEQTVAHYTSVGGPKNSRSDLVVVRPNAYIAEETYKRVKPRRWFYLHDDGVLPLGTVGDIKAHAVLDDDTILVRACKALVALMGWELAPIE